MTRRRWIADEVNGNRAALTGDNARHLARVLRAKAGEQFDVSADGAVRLGTVISVTDERVEFELGEAVDASEPGASIHLLLAVFKFDRLEWAIEKATELGVARITPIIASRTDAHFAAAATKRVERWRKIAREAAQQSRRVSPPDVESPEKLKAALESADAGCLRIVLSEEEKAHSLAGAFADTKPGSPVMLAIGPEGGWTPEELRLFAEYGWKPASLGPTILRAETAAIAAVAIANALISPQ